MTNSNKKMKMGKIYFSTQSIKNKQCLCSTFWWTNCHSKPTTRKKIFITSALTMEATPVSKSSILISNLSKFRSSMKSFCNYSSNTIIKELMLNQGNSSILYLLKECRLFDPYKLNSLNSTHNIWKTIFSNTWLPSKRSMISNRGIHCI